MYVWSEVDTIVVVESHLQQQQSWVGVIKKNKGVISKSKNVISVLVV